MKMEHTPNGSIVVTLSRRNLRTLLNKLDRVGSARTLFITMDDNDGFLLVRAEEDAEHYMALGRGPGYVLDAPE